METEVRAAEGKKLFEWEPDGNVITIVIKQKKYVIKLNTDGESPFLFYHVFYPRYLPASIHHQHEYLLL